PGPRRRRGRPRPPPPTRAADRPPSGHGDPARRRARRARRRVHVGRRPLVPAPRAADEGRVPGVDLLPRLGRGAGRRRPRVDRAGRIVADGAGAPPPGRLNQSPSRITPRSTISGPLRPRSRAAALGGRSNRPVSEWIRYSNATSRRIAAWSRAFATRG